MDEVDKQIGLLKSDDWTVRRSANEALVKGFARKFKS